MSYLDLPSSLIGRGKGLVKSLFEIVSGDFSDHESRLNALESSTVAPVGLIVPYANASVPAGWLKCDASELGKLQYPELYAVIGDTYSNGSEVAGNFRLPDSKGRCFLGRGTGTGLTARTIGTKLGEELHALTTAELPVHTHAVTDPQHSHLGARKEVTAGGSNTSHQLIPTTSLTTVTRTSNSSGTAITVNNAGSGTGHNNMQPFLALLMIIKV